MKIFTTRTRFLEDRLLNWFEGYIIQSIYKGINHEEVVSDAWINYNMASTFVHKINESKILSNAMKTTQKDN